MSVDTTVVALLKTLKRLPEDQSARILELCLDEGTIRRLYGMSVDFALAETRRILDEPRPWNKEAG